MTFTHRILSMGFGLLALTSIVRADYISGTVWAADPATVISQQAPTLGNLPGNSSKIATFTANGINYSGDAPGAYTIGGFLNSFGVAGNIAYMNGYTASTNLDNTDWEFKGSAYFTQGQTFSVTHDDGVNIYINGVAEVLTPGNTPSITDTYTYNGPTGTYAFDFIYDECCGGQADFITNLIPSAPSTATAAPEPSSALLLLIPGLSIAAIHRFRRSSSRS